MGKTVTDELEKIMNSAEWAKQISEDYAAAVKEGECLCCTNAYEGMDISFIPCEVLCAGQGCSSPLNAFMGELKEGMTVVDLGCGAGMDVFLAARSVGESGRAIGIDMTPEMLAVAKQSEAAVSAALGYEKPNTAFEQAYIERTPVKENSVDFVMSNCVINLSADKRAVFREIARILKPKGQFVISDVFAAEPVPEHIKSNREMISRCIGGAISLPEFYAHAEAAGFTGLKEIEQGPYKTVDDIKFSSATIRAVFRG